MSQHPFNGGRRGWRSVPVLVALALVGLVLAACGGDGSSDPAAAGGESGPIKVGTIMSTKGVLAPYGIPEQRAIELAIDEANAKGGVAGRKLEWKHYDPEGDAAKGVSQTRRLMQQDQVDVIVGGGASSGVALAMDQILTPATMFFATGEASPELSTPAGKHPYTFQTTFTSQLVIERMLKHLREQGAKRVAFLADSSEYGQSGLEAAKALAGKYGLTIDGVKYDPSVSDLKPQLTNAARKNPDAYMNWTATPSGVVFIRNANALGLDKDAIIMQGFTFSNPKLMKQAGSAGEGVIVSAAKITVTDTLPGDDPQRAELERFSKAYEQQFDEPATIYAAQAYDAARITLEALRRTEGNTSGDALAEALEQGEPIVGNMGVFEYAAEDHFGLDVNDVVITEWDGSKFRLVE